MSDIMEVLAILAIFLGVCFLGNYVCNLDKTINHYRGLNDDNEKKRRR